MSHLLWKDYCELSLSCQAPWGGDRRLQWQKICIRSCSRQDSDHSSTATEKKVPWGIRRPWQRLHSEDFTHWDTRGHPTSLRIQSGCFSLHRLMFNLATQTWPCSVCHPRELINTNLFWKAALWHWKPSVTALFTQKAEYSLIWTHWMTTNRKRMSVLELRNSAYRNICIWPISL